MEALTSSCSKALVDSLGSSTPRGATAFHFSDRLEFCFSPCSQNDKVGSFRFLQMVHNKGISPVHAVPSKTQGDLETEEPQAQQTKETKVVRIKFQLQKDCKFGEQFLIVGDDPIIGAWDPSNALPMTWSEGDVWFIELDVPAGKPIQFKFILKGLARNIIWQPGSDRIIQTWETINRITVCEDWENAELQKIIEEEQPDHSNRKPQIDSEMSKSSENLDHLEEEMVSVAAKAQGHEDSKTHPEDWENAELQKIIEEEQPDHSNGKPQIDSEMSNSSENLDHPEEEMVCDAAKAQGHEDSKTHPEEEPLAELDLQQVTGDSTSSSIEKPMAIVAENIGSSDNIVNSTTHKRCMNNIAVQSETHIVNVPPVKNQEKEVVKGNLFDFEGGPVLVPGLTTPDVPAEETSKGEVEERTTMDISIGTLEANDQNTPEFNEEQDSENGTPQEITETLSDEPEPELVDNEYEEKFHLTTAMDVMIDSHTVHEDVLQNDVQWGRGILKKVSIKSWIVLRKFPWLTRLIKKVVDQTNHG